MQQLLNDILTGSFEEKMEAIETIWSSMDENSVPISDEEIRITKERYEEYLNRPEDTIDWLTARLKLKDKYGF